MTEPLYTSWGDRIGQPAKPTPDWASLQVMIRHRRWRRRRRAGKRSMP